MSNKPFNDKGPFKVGELVRIVEVEYFPENLHKETTVVEVKICRTRQATEEKLRYICYLPSFKVPFAFEEHQLRRVRPPEQSSGFMEIMSLFKQPEKEIENV